MLYVQRTDDSYHHYGRNYFNDSYGRNDDDLYDYEDFYGSGYDDYEEGSGGII